MTGPQDRLIVVTGGPGTGKTTLLDALTAVGFAATDEAGRAIIRHQTGIGRPDLHIRQPVLFGELMLAWDIRSYHMASATPGPVFFDRAVPELAAYARLIGQDVPPHVDAAAQAHRYHRQVFLAPVWPDIYVQDAERRQTLNDAWRIQDLVTRAYVDYDYEVVELPLTGVGQRVRFVVDACGLDFPDAAPDPPSQSPPDGQNG